jgi:hypothetical protein
MTRRQVRVKTKLKKFVLYSSSDDFDSYLKPTIQILTTNQQTLANNEVQAKLIQVT